MAEKEVQEQPSDQGSNLGEDINVDENVAGTAHLQEAMGESEADKLQQELQDQKDKYLRLYAEFDNFKRRSAKERLELTQTAGREVIQSLLDVLDDSDRAEKQMDNATDISQVQGRRPSGV